jgi:hypothetical protein
MPLPPKSRKALNATVPPLLIEGMPKSEKVVLSAMVE